MQILIEPLAHPYLREAHFSEAEIAGFVRYSHCPACGGTPDATVVASLGLKSWAVRLDLVQCKNCNHLHYANPPGVDWFTNFYRKEWNADRGESVSAGVKPSSGVKDNAARLAADAGQSPQGSSVLEIGCGAGDMMAGLAAEGFSTLYGTEASDYRAAATALRFPGRVFKGGYEAVPPDLSFDFIYSHHVVEHIYDPWQAFGWMAERLKPGGLISITVPNAKVEPVLNQLLFIPHLHSFCHRSLKMMGESHGFNVAFWPGANTPYEITAVYSRADDRRTWGKSFVAGQEAEDLASPFPMQQRFAALGDGAVRPDIVHFALHAGEKGAAVLGGQAGLQRVAAGKARLSRLTTSLGRHIAKMGLRKVGNKWLGRNRTITVRRMPDGLPLPIVGSVAGDVAVHIK
jgi:2-polyprenyl-3-methyl-5-hydroxy-6-metoxy-1,4-benzoquinol methylase